MGKGGEIGQEVYHIKVKPTGKPRMTQRDKWKKRPCVLRYHEFKDTVKQAMKDSGVTLTDGNTALLFLIPMPPSWSKKKQTEMRCRPHQQKPDIDNLQKALFDAMLTDDSKIWQLRSVVKRWVYEGEEGIRIINYK